MKHPQSEPTKRFPTFSVDDAISEKLPLASYLLSSKPLNKISDQRNALDDENESSDLMKIQDIIDSVSRLCDSVLNEGDTHTTFGSFARIPNQLGIRVAAISEITRIALCTLLSRAPHTLEDFKTLKDVAEKTCEALALAGEQAPDHELKVAPPSKTWPVNIARRKKDRDRQIKSLLHDKKLGSASKKSPSDNPPKYDAPGTKVAKALILHIQSMRKTSAFCILKSLEPNSEEFNHLSKYFPLPKSLLIVLLNLEDPDPQHYQQWKEACGEVLIHSTNGKPERDPFLRKKIGDPAADSYAEDHSMTPDSLEDSKQALETCRHEKIMKRVTDAVKPLIEDGIGIYWQ